MSISTQLSYILEDLRKGTLRSITNENTKLINDVAMQSLSLSDPSMDQIDAMRLVIVISNILYNNTDRSMLPLEDGVYDLLLEKYKVYDPNYQVGAEPIIFKESHINTEDKPLVRPITYLDPNRLYLNDLICPEGYKREPVDDRVIPIMSINYNSRLSRDTAHNYPELVGTLDKCKFVLNKHAKECGVFDDANVKIFERDFIQEHLAQGIITPEEKFYMIMELKYDGVSVEADVTDRVLSARSRGDTNNDKAVDLSPILEGYKFKRISEPLDKPIGMKFEAILTYDNLAKLNQMKGKNYANCRNAIVGIFGAIEGREFRDLITLVPLASSLKFNRLEDIRFLNNAYTSGVPLHYAVAYGNYKEILFQVKQFVEDAEYMRKCMPFMYDGVVISYLDPVKREMLGRKNSVNKFSIAIKFNAIKKETVFLGCTYTIGQNGIITPMIHYKPVEFLGTIHTKSSGHSYERFKNLQLRKGDVITVEYTNDVMPYVKKPDIEANRLNQNPLEEFVSECPFCGHKLLVSPSGKSMYCPNINCEERNIIRMGNMLAKLDLKDFSEQTIRAINKLSLTALSGLMIEDVRFLGEVTSKNLINRITELKDTPMYDYVLVGSLGFSSVAIEKWKTIFSKLDIVDLLVMTDEELTESLSSIKGIGPLTISTIVNEREYFRMDLVTIMKDFKVINSKEIKQGGKVIRFTGVRDDELVNRIKSLYPNTDIGEGGVTKATNILVVPYEGFSSSKTAKASKYGTIMITPKDLSDNIARYLE